MRVPSMQGAGAGEVVEESLVRADNMVREVCMLVEGY